MVNPSSNPNQAFLDAVVAMFYVQANQNYSDLKTKASILADLMAEHKKLPANDPEKAKIKATIDKTIEASQGYITTMCKILKAMDSHFTSEAKAEYLRCKNYLEGAIKKAKKV